MAEQRVKEEDLPCSQATIGPAYYWGLLDMAPSMVATPCIQAIVKVRFQGLSHFLLFALHLYPPRELHSIGLKSGLGFGSPQASLSLRKATCIIIYTVSLEYTGQQGSGDLHWAWGQAVLLQVSVILLLGQGGEPWHVLLLMMGQLMDSKL